ncbi:MAG TPA: EamA family transporter [Verrucomicrobiae bacterium]|nr:EamA family transporter [Verrucomicrobiae bacterium]
MSIRWTSVANATLLANAAPVFVAFVAWWVFGETLSGTHAVGALIVRVAIYLAWRGSCERQA